MSSEHPSQYERRSEATQVDININTSASLGYWNSVPATANSMLGMLGPYPWYSRIDLRGSRSFLAKIRRLIPGCPTEGKLDRGVDCGAGVGRVTEGFLRHVCKVVDAVEPVAKFTQVLDESALKKDNVIGDVYTLGLEDWIPDKKYDLIWIQFCVGHLNDRQLVELIERCRAALTGAGILVVKENMSTDPKGNDMYDEEDSSVTRTNEKFRSIFEAAGMRVIISDMQTGFPKEFKLLPVRFYALRPKV
ncbi:N-terminal protein methyltransferase [Aspergillus undulatus]|uniref:N-terminal protein methyltransferase n=1 Tax=Aspergillus undulatus TaxID=1810928 RepID=UPI003CCDC093